MRREFWWSLVLLGVAGLYMGFRFVGLYWDFGAASDELPASVRAYRAAGLPWTAADLAGPKPSDAENAAPLVRQAIAAMPGKAVTSAFEVAYREGTADPTAFGSALVILHGAAKRPKLDYGRDWDEPNLLFPELANVKLMVKALAARAEAKAARGDDADALTDIEDARRVGALTGQEPILIASLAGIACEGIALDAVERCLSQAAGKPGRLARYRAWLSRPAPPRDMVPAIMGETYLDVVFVRNFEAMGGGRSINPMNDLAIFNDELPRSAMKRDGLPANVRARAYLTRHNQMWTELMQRTNGLKGDPGGMGRIWEAIGNRSYRGLSHQFDAILFRLSGNVLKTPLIPLTRQAVTLAFADALIQRAKVGRWPTKIDAMDPFGKGPLRSRFDGKRFRVWSVGRNGVDDGGLTDREADAAGKRSDDMVAVYPQFSRTELAGLVPAPTMGMGR